MKDKERTTLASAFESITPMRQFFAGITTQKEQDRFEMLCEQIGEQKEFSKVFKLANELSIELYALLPEGDDSGDFSTEIESPIFDIIQGRAYRQVLAERKGAANPQ